MSVAIRTITRLQDADDFGSTPGAGNDGYALTWDNDAGEFVLSAAAGGVTDHGALGGLADDDHTQYLLATGARTGASAQAQTFTNGIIGPAWKPASNSTTALQLQNAGGTAILTVDTTNSYLSLASGVPIMVVTSRFLHRYGTNNLFVGLNAGNFTTTGIGGNIGLGPNALATCSDGSYNVGIGLNALEKVTSGVNNVALGGLAGRALTTGSGNFALGYYALQAATDAIYNVAIGSDALRAYNASNVGRNIAIGMASLMALTSGVNNVSIGTEAGYSLTTGGSNIFIGQSAGWYETGSNKIIIDSQWRGSEALIRTGAPIYAEMSGTLTSQFVRINGVLESLMNDSATNAATTQVKIGHNTSGTATAAFGSRVLFELQSSTTASQSAAAITSAWYEATHASRKADLVLTAYDTAEREGLRIRGAGSAAAIGFLGATPAARQAHVADPSGGATVDTQARSAINSILATLETFGFHATS